MQIRREEIRTGLLVVVSLGIITAVLLALGAPGVFKPVNRFNIFFDNAGGLKQGAPVLLAGRKIGQVTKLMSPVPAADRPKEFPNYEALVEVTIDRDAKIYRIVKVRMLQYSLLGEQVIDFASGDEEKGLAPNGAYFVGERAKDFAQSIADAVDVIQNVVTPVAQEAQRTMVELQGTAKNLKQMTAPDSNMNQALGRFRDVGQNLAELSGSNGKLQGMLDNLTDLTGPQSHLHGALENVDTLTTNLVESKSLEISLSNFREASAKLNDTMTSLSPQLNAIGLNLAQATDTVKRQPWRLVWPSTKKYDETADEPVEVRKAQPVKRTTPAPRAKRAARRVY